VAVVTGASKGIGTAIAKQLADVGAPVVANYAANKAGADRVVTDIKNHGGRAIAVQADVSKPADICRLFAETKSAFDRLDTMINNAGICEFRPLAEITRQHFHKHNDLNVLGLLVTPQEAVKLFGLQGGSVVNSSSVVSMIAPPKSAVYSGTKAAVDAVTRSLVKELAPRKVRVNSINPNMVETEGTTFTGIVTGGSDFEKQYVAMAPLGRVGRPKDIAPAAVYLASPESSCVTGETLYISSGVH
jgi:3-oxoacyl-[acyl-carrier protein] reductase